MQFVRPGVLALAVGVVFQASAAPPAVSPMQAPWRIPPQLVESAQSKARPFTIERTEQWTLRSKAGRSFEISVALPRIPPPAAGYPVFYVLDADISFATLTETARNQEILLGPVVIVGIGYPSDAETANRRFDLTPVTDAATLPPAGPGGWGPIGGADGFLAFIRGDLEPVIRARVPVDKDRRALFGHSLGGLFVLHVLFTHADAFNVYIAGSPSIWWGNRQLLQELPPFIARQRREGTHRRLLITVGGLEVALNPEEIRASMALKLPDPEAGFRRFNMVGNARELAMRLKTLSTRGLDVGFVSFTGETHNSSIPAYLGRGARWTLSGWIPSTSSSPQRSP